MRRTVAAIKEGVDRQSNMFPDAPRWIRWMTWMPGWMSGPVIDFVFWMEFPLGLESKATKSKDGES